MDPKLSQVMWVSHGGRFQMCFLACSKTCGKWHRWCPYRRRLLWDHFSVVCSFRCHPALCTCGSWFLERLLVIKGRQGLSTFSTSGGSLLRSDFDWFWISNGSDRRAPEGKQHPWFVQRTSVSRTCHSFAPWSASASLWQHQYDPCGYPVCRARPSEGIWAFVKGASVTCWNPQQGLAPQCTGGAFGTWFFHGLWLFSIQFRGANCANSLFCFNPGNGTMIYKWSQVTSIIFQYFWWLTHPGFVRTAYGPVAFMDGLLAARRVKRANVLRMAFRASTKFKNKTWESWEYCVFRGALSPCLGICCFFLAFLRFLMGVEPILGNLLGNTPAFFGQMVWLTSIWSNGFARLT